VWSLTPNGVLMNGIGYCLEALPGQPHGTPLYVDFADQCGGTSGQAWTYTGSKGQLSSPGPAAGTGTCVGLGGSASAGTDIVRASCGHGPRWSLGFSAVTLAAGTGSGAAGGSYSASVTVANATSAQSAYGVTVAFGLPRSLAAAGLQPAGAASGFRCSVRTATCTGTLAAGTSGHVDISGRLPAGAAAGDSYALTARATVADTSQRSSTARLTASVKVLVGAAAPAPATGGVILSLSLPLLLLIIIILLIVVILFLGGGLLVGLAARRRSSHRPAYGERRPHEENPPYLQRSPNVELLHQAERPPYEEQRPYVGQASYLERPPYQERSPYAEQPSDVEQTSYDEIPRQVERRPYEGRRRRTGPEPAVEPEDLPRPRHHSHR
jgi:hypothetical protein